jgi:exonuclease SbcC
VPLTRETTDATQAEIERILGLTRTTFRASAFLRQGDGAAFTEAQPRDRKAILAEILNLAVYDQLLACARDDIRDAARPRHHRRQDHGARTARRPNATSSAAS